MDGKEVTNVMSSDQQIAQTLALRTTKELKDFQRKLKGMDSPQAWAIWFHLIRELMFRHLFGDEEANV